jgi:hypothetical protein
MGLAHVILSSLYFIPKVPLGRGYQYIAPPLHLGTLNMIWYLTWIEHMLPLRKFNNLNYLELFFKASSVIETFLVFGILLGFGLLLRNSTNSGIFPSQISTLLHSDLSFGILPLVFPTKILLQWWNGPTRALFLLGFPRVCLSCSSPRHVEPWDQGRNSRVDPYHMVSAATRCHGFNITTVHIFPQNFLS